MNKKSKEKFNNKSYNQNKPNLITKDSKKNLKFYNSKKKSKDNNNMKNLRDRNWRESRYCWRRKERYKGLRKKG